MLRNEFCRIVRAVGQLRWLTLGLAVQLAQPSASHAAKTNEISYNRDIRPILSDNCFYCHGPDKNKRKGKFRLDVRDDAVAKGAIVPGKVDESELIHRINATNEDDLMPPPDSAKKLTQAQKDLLQRWIASGAKYEPHWAYIPPVKPPEVKGKNMIDVLERQRLQQVGLKPSKEADRRTLARRLYFDLIGLPPKPEEVDAFINDHSRGAYSNLVERLLARPQYGERMAIPWLDVARFADTDGYHGDNGRNIFPYRDYVIRSFNANKPFDQFTREQIAGDLLPNSTLEDKVGSAFNRLLLTTAEGGAQPKDYEARMLTDRVRAVSTIWLGQTFGCSQCHDHKFDPITQRDFYSMGSFFADIKEPIIGGREPGMFVPDEKQSVELDRLDRAVESAQKDYDAPHPELAEAFSRWSAEQQETIEHERSWQLIAPSKTKTVSGAKLSVKADSSILAKGKLAEKDAYTLTFTNSFKNVAGLRLEALPDDSLPAKGPGRAGNGNFVLSEVVAKVHGTNHDAGEIKFSAARASHEQTELAGDNPYKAWNAAAVIDGDAKGDTWGWAILPDAGKPNELYLDFAEPLTVQPGETLTLVLKQNLSKHALGHFRLAVTADPKALRPPAKELRDALTSLGTKTGNDKERKDKLFAAFKKVTPELATIRDRLAAAQKAKADLEAALPRCIVSVSTDQRRTVRILPRGNFLNETGEIMHPALPQYLTASLKQPNDRMLTRLDLANWLVSRENPLTARVVVNRLWKQFFGIGLSKVADDLGAQGELPPNQALLDWLACEFMDSGWDIKHMVRLIVNSETYRQTSVMSKQLRQRDPLNREVAAQSRWRLDAELVRDNALSISGLLNPKIGGPSVKPYQPAGYWENLNFPVRNWDASTGGDQYRRGMYTWWQRSYVHPSMLAFDAPTREECAADRNHSNIPQQALVLLNDPTYVEASRAFAVRILKEGGNDTKSRIIFAWRQALDRKPTSEEIKMIEKLLDKELSEYRGDKAAAEALLKVGMSPAPTDMNQAELAAWTNVARVILNLYETITRA